MEAKEHQWKSCEERPTQGNDSMSGSQSGQKEPLGCNEGKCSRCNKREHQDVVKRKCWRKGRTACDSRITVSKTTSKIYVPVGCGKSLRCEEEKNFRKSPNGKVIGLRNTGRMLSSLLQWYCGGSERVRTQNQGLAKHCKKRCSTRHRQSSIWVITLAPPCCMVWWQDESCCDMSHSSTDKNIKACPYPQLLESTIWKEVLGFRYWRK